MKERLHKLKQVGDALHNDHQHNDQSGKRGHGRLLLPSGADEHLIEDGNDDSHRRNFEDQINFSKITARAIPAQIPMVA